MSVTKIIWGEARMSHIKVLSLDTSSIYIYIYIYIISLINLKN